tara:strand:- start:2885 stop:4579 length:1695 start_codon:yes stop_codon:yes gene_type:complete
MFKKSRVIVLLIGLGGASAYFALELQAKQVDQPALHEQVLEVLREQRDVISRPLADLPRNLPVFNAEAVIPPQCYTRTAGQFNPCYVCHQNPIPNRENKMADGGLQLEYSFSDVGMTNHWRNLFEDRSERVAKISDGEIDRWVDTDNYSKLAPRLKAAEFRGWIPDLENLHLGKDAFDDDGFARDGSHWVAFNYKPLPSTFWPTNGSTDDVMIRLPEPFRVDANGDYSRDIYKANLAIVEARVKGFDTISALPITESKVGIDLDGDGKLGVATRVSAVDDYVGQAAGQFIDTYMYPEGTEFLHTVRYVGITSSGDIGVSTRMKEVRYMKKWRAQLKEVYGRTYQLEAYAKEAGQLPNYMIIGDWGLDNGFGWSLSGFIEARDGELRTATYEENLFCMGCHATVGATIDKTFSFPRKVDGAAGWGYIDLHAMTDVPNIGETRGEILTYLERVGGGGEFRSNPEMYARWFTEDGEVNVAAIENATSVYELITPSVARARTLNKAYRVIVEDQDYIYGRDPTVTPPVNVYHQIDNATAPTLPMELFTPWDIRLHWGDAPLPQSNAAR